MKNSLDDIVKKQRARLQFARLFAKFQKADPDYLAELGFGSNGSAAHNPRPRRVVIVRKKATENQGFDGIKKVLKDRNNDWTSTSYIRTKSNLTRAQAAYAIKQNLDKLESRPHPTHGRKLQYRLKVVS